MNDCRFIAAALDELAEWIDDGLASGRPPKHLAQQAAIALRHFAVVATRGDVSGEALAESLMAPAAAVLQPRA